MQTPFLIYKTSNNDIKVDVLLKDETIWLNQRQMVELFAVQGLYISKYISNMFDKKELTQSTISKMEIV